MIKFRFVNELGETFSWCDFIIGESPNKTETNCKMKISE